MCSYQRSWPRTNEVPSCACVFILLHEFWSTPSPQVVDFEGFHSPLTCPNHFNRTFLILLMIILLYVPHSKLYSRSFLTRFYYKSTSASSFPPLLPYLLKHSLSATLISSKFISHSKKIIGQCYNFQTKQFISHSTLTYA